MSTRGQRSKAQAQTGQAENPGPQSLASTVQEELNKAIENDSITDKLDFHKIRSTPSFRRSSRLLSYIGCGLSTTCLLITLALYGSNRELRKKQPNQIFMCLCGNLLCLYIAFILITSLDQRQDPNDPEVDNDGLCGFLAALVQYFTLSSLCWMGVEGINMYLLFVKVMKSYVPSFMVKASLFACGVPALVVLLTGVIARKNFALQDVCFLDQWPTIGGVLVPVALIIIVNIILFVLVLIRLSRRVPGKIVTERQTHQERVKRVHNAVCIFLLLGLTWVFGYLLLIKSGNRIFQIIFIVLNSFQGFFIFVLYGLRQHLIGKQLAGYWQSWRTANGGVVLLNFQPQVIRKPSKQITG